MRWLKRRMGTPARLLPLLALFLTGCAATESVIVKQRVPAQLLSLPDRPPLPAGRLTDRQLALFILEQQEVVDACYSQMGRLGNLLDTQD